MHGWLTSAHTVSQAGGSHTMYSGKVNSLWVSGVCLSAKTLRLNIIAEFFLSMESAQISLGVEQTTNWKPAKEELRKDVRLS